MNEEQLVERELVVETIVVEETLPRCYFFHSEFQMRLNPGRPVGKPAASCLSYGTVMSLNLNNRALKGLETCIVMG